jgi:transcriptional regulator with XRE-family HTH domain
MATCNLKSILDKEGISQADLARKTGIASGTIYKYTGESRTPSLRTANKIVKALNSFPNISKQYELKEIFPTVK